MVNWSLSAKLQLKEIHDFIANDSKIYARKVTDEILRQSMAFDNMPYRYKMMGELRDEREREYSIYSYRIIFEALDDDSIAVIAVIHKRRNITQDDVPRANDT